MRVDKLVEVLEKAFRPLECRVTVTSHPERVAFIVFDSEGKPVVMAPERPTLELRHPVSLHRVIDDVRARLEGKGFKLDAWSAPL